jgi:hypothetical protein
MEDHGLGRRFHLRAVPCCSTWAGAHGDHVPDAGCHSGRRVSPPGGGVMRRGLRGGFIRRVFEGAGAGARVALWKGVALFEGRYRCPTVATDSSPVGGRGRRLRRRVVAPA